MMKDATTPTMSEKDLPIFMRNGKEIQGGTALDESEGNLPATRGREHEFSVEKDRRSSFGMSQKFDNSSEKGDNEQHMRLSNESISVFE